MHRTMLLLSLMIAGVAGGAQAHFRLDVSPGEYRAWKGVITLREISVGESIVTLSPGCASKGAMFMPLDTEALSGETAFLTRYRVERRPGGKVAVTIIPRAGADSTDAVISEAVSKIIGMSRFPDTCDRHGVPDDQMLQIETINGASSAKQMLDALR